MTGGTSTPTERPNKWLLWGRVFLIASFVVWVCWGLFLAYFWITKGFDGIPLGPALLLALAAPPMKWLSDWLIKRGETNST